MLRSPNPNPIVGRDGLPTTPLQAWKLGLMSAHLLSKGYALAPLREGQRPHRTGDGDTLVCAVEESGTPVGVLGLRGEEQITYAPTQFGMQFMFDSQALPKTDHWPGVATDAPEQFIAVDGAMGYDDTRASTREDAAREYFGGEYWAGRHALRPESVTTARVQPYDCNGAAQGHTAQIIDNLTDNLAADYDDYAADAIHTLEHADVQAELETQIAPIIQQWLRRHLGGFNFYHMVEEQDTPDPGLAKPAPAQTPDAAKDASPKRPEDLPTVAPQEAIQRLREATGDALNGKGPESVEYARE